MTGPSFTLYDEGLDLFADKYEPFQMLMNERAAAAHRAHMAQLDRQLKQLLGQWVSELEPVIQIRTGTWELIGLGIKGSPVTVIPAAP